MNESLRRNPRVCACRHGRTLLLVATMLCGLLACATDSWCGTKRITASYTYTYGDDESLNSAKQACRTNALRGIAESACTQVYSTSEMLDGVLVTDEILTETVGIVTHVEELDMQVSGRTVRCELRAEVDVDRIAALGRTENRIAAREYRVLVHNVVVQKGAYAADDSNRAPDAYIVARDGNGRVLFHSGDTFLNKKDPLGLVQNRNNYHPDFKGIGFSFDFAVAPEVAVYLVDWDGCEGVLCARRSADDPIGAPLVIRRGDLVGKRMMQGQGWSAEMEVLPVGGP